MKVRYTAKCSCGYTTDIYIDISNVPILGRVFAAGSADVHKTCRCGNGGFVFRVASKRGKEIIARAERLREFQTR